MSQPNPQLTAIADQRGLGPGLFFAGDSESKPGHLIVHFVRFETVVFPLNKQFDKTAFKTLDPANDPRLSVLASCIRHEEKE